MCNVVDVRNYLSIEKLDKISNEPMVVIFNSKQKNTRQKKNEMEILSERFFDSFAGKNVNFGTFVLHGDIHNQETEDKC